jgi:hypothetical protein
MGDKCWVDLWSYVYECNGLIGRVCVTHGCVEKNVRIIVFVSFLFIYQFVVL